MRRARIEAGFSQRRLAKKLKESPTYIHLIENLRRDVSVAELVEIEHALGLASGELLRGIR